MARKPYNKRIAQGSAAGAMRGGAAGFKLGGLPGGILGSVTGGLSGALMARPGDDEEQLRARMRKLEMGVLGDEEAAIMGRFMDPVAATANEQLVRSRAVASPGAATGAQAREAVAGQRAARGDIAEASREGALAVMDLGESRSKEAQRISEGLLNQDIRRDELFQRTMLNEGLEQAGEAGAARGEERGQRLRERGFLPQGLLGTAGGILGRLRDPSRRSVVGTNAVSAGGTAGAADALAREVAGPPPLPGVPGPPAEHTPLQIRNRNRRDFVADMEALNLQALDDEAGFADTAGIADPAVSRELAVEGPSSAIKSERLGETILDVVAASDQAALEAEGRAEDYALDPEYRDLRKAYPGFTPADVADMFELYREMDPRQKAKSLDDYGAFLEVAQGL